jgi:hypothetical protein
MRKNVLLIGGSVNQTTIMHQISHHLTGCEVRFSPFYADGYLGWMARRGLLEFTILAGQARERTTAYLESNGLPVDYRGQELDYDLVVTTVDLILPRNLADKKMVLVQEGMMDPETWRYRLVRGLRLPRYLANTSMTGLSHAYSDFCVMSEGYRDLFVRKGISPSKIQVTGIPNFDNADAFMENDFPHKGYVLAATSCLRETLKHENRKKFIREAQRIAGGRQLIFKLHPNERIGRATREIEALAPEALVFADGNTNHMIANCDVLVTRYSSVVFVASALGKEIHSDLDPEFLDQLSPRQNGGTSARRIAEICLARLEENEPAVVPSREAGHAA